MAPAEDGPAGEVLGCDGVKALASGCDGAFLAGLLGAPVEDAATNVVGGGASLVSGRDACAMVRMRAADPRCAEQQPELMGW